MMVWTTTCRKAVTAAVVAGAVLASLHGPARAGDEGIDVTVKTVAPESLRGRLVSFSLDDGMVLHGAGGEITRAAAEDIVRMVSAAVPREPRSQDATLELSGGDQVRGGLGEPAGELVTIDDADLGELRVPLEMVQRLTTARAREPAFQEYVDWYRRRPAANEDQILLTNSDVVRGFITSISAAGVSLESDLGESLVPYRLVLMACLASPPPVPLEQRYVTLTMCSGTRLTATALRWSGNVAEAQTRYGRTVRIEAERIMQLEVIGGRWEWLGDHQPISDQQTAMLSLPWEFVTDHNVRGGPIVVAGESFDHGVGVHSRSSLTYELKGAYQEFVTYFGIDDDSGPYADTSVVILVDGKRRFAQEHVRRGRLFGPARLDVAHANRIELVVDFGDNGDVQDRFNWVEAALIR